MVNRAGVPAGLRKFVNEDLGLAAGVEGCVLYDGSRRLKACTCSFRQ